MLALNKSIIRNENYFSFFSVCISTSFLLLLQIAPHPQHTISYFAIVLHPLWILCLLQIRLTFPVSG